VEEIRTQTLMLLEKIKSQEAAREFLVDRRMINQFLVTYVSKDSDWKTQQSMLLAMSKVLQFSEEEKEQLGMNQSQPSSRGYFGFLGQ